MIATQLRQTKRCMILSFLFVLGFLCAFTGMALAQIGRGAIHGVVTDTKGAVVQGAQVTLTNKDTNFSLKNTTDTRGAFSFSPIKFGHYILSASAPKFATTIQQNITVNIQDILNIGLILKPGSVSETVTVTSAPAMMDNENATVGQVVDTIINSTPLNGRSGIYIAQLTAGVDPGLSAGGARGGGTGDFSANGQRITQNNFILDGVDNNVNVDDFQNENLTTRRNFGPQLERQNSRSRESDRGSFVLLVKSKQRRHCVDRSSCPHRRKMNYRCHIIQMPAPLNCQLTISLWSSHDHQSQKIYRMCPLRHCGAHHRSCKRIRCQRAQQSHQRGLHRHRSPGI